MRRRTLIALLVPMLALSLALPTPASAVDASLAATASSMWQTNNTVRALGYANGTVYAGGLFTSVRPPAAAAGTGEVPRTYLAAFSSSTGALVTTFDHVLDGPVWAITPSADGTRVFVGGDFSTVDGQARSRLAAFSTSTGALISTWLPRTNGRVKALAVAGNTLYVGGNMTGLNGQVRSRLGALNATTGSVLPWAPAANADVYTLAAAKTGGGVYAGGNFDTINGEPYRAVAAIDGATGATRPFPAKSAIPATTTACRSYVKDLRVDATTVYAAAAGDGGGCFDGTFAANLSDGELKWRNNCLGATEAIEIVGSWLLKGSHAHDCSRSGGFPQTTSPDGPHNLLAESLTDGSLGPWYPDTDSSGDTNVGPFAMATDGTQLFVGGDFRNVNTRPQQGVARFGSGPNTQPGRPTSLTASSVNAGAVQVLFKAAVDTDDETLTYRLFRDNGVTPIATWTDVRSTFWLIPTFSYTDTEVAPGSTHNYQVDVSDGSLRRLIQSANVTVATATARYAAQVQSAAPFLSWRLGDSTGTLTAADSSGNNRTGTYAGTITRGVSGALNGDTNTAATFNGSSGRVNADTSSGGPQQFTVEGWFRTNTNRGGKIVGFGNSRTGTSNNYDRHVYMTNDGRLVYGVNNNGLATIATTGTYNDNDWHHFAGSLGPEGMRFVVDGVLIGSNPNTNAQGFNGYWKVGGDNLGNWPDRPTSNFFAGTIDEITVHQYSLPQAIVVQHYLAR